MIREIGDGDSQGRDEFCAAVRQILPILCFESERIQTFLAEAVKKVLVIDSGAGRAFVGRSGSVGITFIIPANWPQRYAIIEEGIKELQSWPRQKAIFMTIDEGIPSHNVYFAGLLPGLGFEMEPKMEMVADQMILSQIARPSLPDDFVETSLTHERSEEAARVLHEAYLTQHVAWPPERCVEDRASWEDYVSAESAERLSSWVAVEHQGRIVGVCQGCARSGAIAISELAVLPSYWRRGLGRYLLVRCMQRFRTKHGRAGGSFCLSVGRTNVPAVSLYESLGFRAQKVFTRAIWERREWAP